MARAIERLTAQRVERLKNAEEPQPGMYADGAGLYLRVTSDGTKNWVLRYMLDRRPRWMGLGPLALYGLQEARAKALDALRKRHEGIDPIDARRAERARQRLDAAKAITFKQCAEACISARRAGWRSGKHAGQWTATLSTYAYPIIGTLPVQAVDTGLVLKVLEPIWTTRSETASRLRGRRSASCRSWLPIRRRAARASARAVRPAPRSALARPRPPSRSQMPAAPIPARRMRPRTKSTATPAWMESRQA